jgi:cephalosporin hydroxylase
VNESQVNSHAEQVPDAEAFRGHRMGWRESLAADDALRPRALELQVEADRHRYTYTWEWLGVPIIRLPDDVMVLQELVWAYRPERIVETGVARGGSLLLNASLQRLAGLDPAVLGIDIAIFPHTRQALMNHPASVGVEVLLGDSSSEQVRESVANFLKGVERTLLILDSDHTHAHVLAELRSLAPLLPPGSFVAVADTVIEELPADYYPTRSWGPGNSPASAVREFLRERDDFTLEGGWGRRALVTEFRDGYLRRRI